MAWTFVEVVRREQVFGKFRVLVKLDLNGTQECFTLKFPADPTNAQITTAVTALLSGMNGEHADAELDDAVENNSMPVLLYQTGAELAARFRDRYRTATRVEAAKLAYWLIERILAGDFTDAQVRNVFGLTVIQYNALKTRLTTIHDRWALVLAEAGE